MFGFPLQIAQSSSGNVGLALHLHEWDHTHFHYTSPDKARLWRIRSAEMMSCKLGHPPEPSWLWNQEEAISQIFTGEKLLVFSGIHYAVFYVEATIFLELKSVIWWLFEVIWCC